MSIISIKWLSCLSISMAMQEKDHFQFITETQQLYSLIMPAFENLCLDLWKLMCKTSLQHIPVTFC